MDPYTKWFRDVSRLDISLVGGKGANLGELAKLKLSVPQGFCITTSAYRDFLLGMEDNIFDLVNSIDFDSQVDLQKKARKIQDAIEKREIPKEISVEVLKACSQMMEEKNTPLAVRSSATAEDLPSASFAGQHETYLNVTGSNALLRKVKHCWASLWSPRAIHYRERHGFEHSKVAMGVVVQRMISPSVSGVMFTYNFKEGNANEIVIESTYGLGEALVSGIVTPDIFIVNKNDFMISDRRISQKDIMVVPSKDGVTDVKVPEDKRSAPTLDNEQIKRIAKLGKKIEKNFAKPQDIEWCIEQEKIYILQSRPQTATETKIPQLSKKELASLEGEWTKSPLDERVAEPLSPFTWSIAQESIPSFFDALAAFGFRVSEDADLARLFYGRPYVNKTELEKIFSDLPGVVDDFIMGGQVTMDRKKIRFSMLPIFFRMILLVNQVHKDWDSALPVLQKKFDALRSFDIEKATGEELLDTLDEIVGIAQSVGTTHALSIVFCEALYQVLFMFVSRYTENPHDICPKLVAGLANRTLDTNKRLWELSILAKRSAKIRNEIQKIDYKSMKKSLNSFEEGKKFLNEFHNFLSTFGHRSPKYDLFFPSWGEDPNLVLELINNYLTSESHMDLGVFERRSMAERKLAEVMVLESISASSLDRIFPIKRLFYIRLLKLAQKYMILRENQQFYIGQGYPVARKIVLELGTRSVKMGVIKEPEDVFFLRIQEIRKIVSGEKIMDIQSKVAKRKEEFEAYKKVEPPLLITKDGPKDVEVGEILKGVAGSPGRVSGNVKIISDISEFGAFKKGEILVAPTTNPSWTPLFLMASGVVTEVGGMLCHGAVVAREYGIPAVLGVRNATSVLKNGQRITVDGVKGVVYTTK
jgi:pyruvate,water dikinase